jgi:hypothetical protein
MTINYRKYNNSKCFKMNNKKAVLGSISSCFKSELLKAMIARILDSSICFTYEKYNTGRISPIDFKKQASYAMKRYNDNV